MRCARMRALTVTALVVAGLASCSPQSEKVAEKPPVAVETAKAERRSLSESVEVVGTLKPKFAADVRAEYPGTVREVLVAEWVPVKKGQVLARLDSREAQAAVLQAQAEAAKAQRERERALKLKAAGLLTQQELEATETFLDAANASLQVAQARLDKTVIRSPLEGVLAARFVSPGDLASGDPIFRVVDNRRFDLTVTVPESKISKITVGMPLAFVTEAVPGRTFEGRVAYLNPSAEEISRTVPVVVEVDNTDGALKSGLFAKGSIEVGRRENILQIPRAALVSWDAATGQGILFSISGGRAQRREVKTGALLDGAVEVLSGVSDGESVVVRGGFNLSEGDRVVTGESR